MDLRVKSKIYPIRLEMKAVSLKKEILLVTPFIVLLSRPVHIFTRIRRRLILCAVNCVL